MAAAAETTTMSGEGISIKELTRQLVENKRDAFEKNFSEARLLPEDATILLVIAIIQKIDWGVHTILDTLRVFARENKETLIILLNFDCSHFFKEKGIISDLPSSQLIHLAATSSPAILHEFLQFVEEVLSEEERIALINKPVLEGPFKNLTALEISVLESSKDDIYNENVRLLRDYGAQIEIKTPGTRKIKKFQPDRINRPYSRFNNTVNWLKREKPPNWQSTIRTIIANPRGPTPTPRMITVAKEKDSLLKLLHEAILANNIEEVERIVSMDDIDINNSFVDLKDGYGPQNVLIRAIQAKNDDIVKLLLKIGADPNYGHHDGYPIHFALIHSASPKIFKLLFKYGGDISNINPDTNETVLHYATEMDGTGNASMVDAILEQIKNGSKVDIDAVSTEGKTALTNAINTDNDDITMSLLNAGADPNVGRWRGQPMHLAVINDFPLGELIKRGGNYRLINPETQDTLLHVAANMDNLALVKQLVNVGKLNVDSPNSDNETPIDIARKNQNKEMFDIMIKESIFDQSELLPFSPADEERETSTTASTKGGKRTRRKRFIKHKATRRVR